MTLSATLPNLEAFVAAAEALNFSAAARQLGLTPQAVSRAVARLEGALGTALFLKTTRALRLTPAGVDYHRACVATLQQLRSAEEALRVREQRVQGALTLSAPTSYGHAILPGQLASFRLRHPQVGIALSLSNRNVDFTRDPCDLAIRMGDLSRDRSLTRLVLGRFAVGLYASPGYLLRRGTPTSIADLAQHERIVFLMPRTNRPLPWTLHRDGEALAETPDHTLAVADDVAGVVSLALAGLGIVQTYDMMVAPAVARGELVEVLPETRGEARPFSLVYPAGRRPTQAARAFIQHLQGALRRV